MPTYFHVDAAQGFGKLTADLVGPIDRIRISGHKIGAPKGSAHYSSANETGTRSR